MNVSSARQLLVEAAGEPDRLTRHLLVAAALREVLAHEPVVVGGTAEEFHTAAAYHETDLDLVGWLTDEDRRILRRLGFTRRGRHWFHQESQVAVEFPESRLAGDPERIVRHRVGAGSVAVIGVDDLYLDRVRQATAHVDETTVEFRSAIAVAAAAYDRIDLRYVQRQLRETERRDPPLGKAMIQVDSTIRRRVRTALR